MNMKTLLAGAVATYFGVMASAYAADKMSPREFVDEASAKGIAEIETGKLALDKGTSADVKSFAQMMIDDHTAANKELATLASEKKLKVADDAELMNKAKAFILKLRDGESFDEAYANNQVKAHEATIELFRDEAETADDAELKAFAKKTLPKLESHLDMAKKLAAAHKKAN
ncbi:DUF4142 domain-containing protein [Pseudomonas mangiferae]|uniref:DUF4142 domain-containing protein n=1 Tax=Pseudomonas mangiferae TaxID=2593654 RepID=A0A553H2D1_9PSED|nr:DUF4142 domain-containing protein [Pseudomonas mangiferae]TRX75910.1 DUF4142 domain-containing protein [Pseudomonas mangiferae]